MAASRTTPPTSRGEAVPAKLRVRMKRRIGFTNSRPEMVPVEPGPEVPGHYEEYTDDHAKYEERKTRVHDSFRRPPVLHFCE